MFDYRRILASCGALTYAELGAMIPEAGGPYVFLRRAFGPPPVAFAYGWMMFFIATPAGIAALGAGAAIFFNIFSGGALDHPDLQFSLGSIHIALPVVRLASSFIILSLMIVNCAPVRANGRIATIFAIVKIAMVAGLALAAFLLSQGRWSNFALNGAGGACIGVSPALRGGLAGVSAALIGALYAFNGWAALTYVAAEVKKPGRTIPFAVAGSMLLMMFLYTAVNASYFFVLTPHTIASISPTSSVGVEIISRLFGNVWRGVAATLIFLSVIATLHVTILVNARITYAFAKGTALFPPLGRITGGTNVPTRAVITNGIMAIALVLFGSFDTLTDFSQFNQWVFYITTGAALFVLRRKEPNTPRPYRAFAYPFVPAIFVGLGLWIVVQTIVSVPVRSTLSLEIICTAFPVYWWRNRKLVRAS